MNVDQMLTELAQRLEDSNATEFTATMKIDALNNAQDRIVTMLDSKYLTELEVLEKFSTQNNEPKMIFGIFNLTSLNNDVLNGSEGILAVRVSGKKYMNRLSIRDMKEFDSDMVEADISDPYYVVFSDRIEIVPTTTIGNMGIDVYYMKKPTELVAGGQCDLNSGLHYLLIVLAESYCWSNSEEFSRVKEAEKIAMEQIGIMNAKVQVQGV